MEVKIVHEQNHYVAYVDGKFFCTADTYTEAAKEISQEGTKNV